MLLLGLMDVYFVFHFCYLFTAMFVADSHINRRRLLMRTSFCRPQKRKGRVNCNYFLRKWGCRSEQARKWVRALHDSCKHKTPFGKDLPVWYWRTTKQQREQDKDVSPCSYLSESETQSLYPCTHSNDAVPASSWAM